MISLIIYGIIAIGLASAAGYAFLIFTNTSRQTTQFEQNQVRLEAATTAVRASLVGINGQLFPPQGVLVSYTEPGGTHAYTGLPVNLGTQRTTPWGQPFEYCPVSPTGTTAPTGIAGTADSVIEYDGTTYATSYYAAASTAGLKSIITSPSNIVGSGSQAGYLAFIVSSIGPGQAIPPCANIQISTSGGIAGVQVPGGTVRAVTGGLPYAQRSIASQNRVEIYVDTDANVNASTGDKSGQDFADATSLSQALILAQSLQPQLAVIFLAGGNAYALPGSGVGSDLNAEDVRPYAEGEGNKLVIATDPNSPSNASLTTSAALTITTPVTFDRISLAFGASVTAVAPVIFKNVTVGNSGLQTLNVKGTKLLVSDSSMSNLQINANNAQIEFLNFGTGTSSFNAPIIASNSLVSFDGTGLATYSFNTASNIALVLTNSVLNVPAASTLNASTTSTAISLTNSRLDVSGTASLVSGGSALGAIDARDGSSVSIGGTVNVSEAGGSVSYGAFLRGSKLGLSGTFNVTGVAAGGIGMQSGEFTGGTPVSAVGTLKIDNNTAIRCLDVYAPYNAQSYIPFYLASPTTGTFQGYPAFATIQHGLYPMNALGAANPYDTAVAASVNTVTVAPGTPETVDRAPLEQAVRSIVNSEFMPGMNINFYGSCHT